MKLQSGILLVSNITNGSRQIEITVDSSLNVNNRASFVDSFSLFFLSRLMVGRKWNCPSGLSEYASWVTCISAYQKIVGDHEYISRASLAFHHLNWVLILLHLSHSAL